MLIDIAGWVGTILILLAYYLLSAKRISGDAVSYQVINLAGAVLLIVNTYAKGAIPSTALNIVWSLIAVKSLLRK